MWTIYDHPRDFPGGFIARRHQVGPGRSEPTSDVVVAEHLQDLREHFEEQGLSCISRQPDDDPVIVETWL